MAVLLRYGTCPECDARVRVEYSERLGRDVICCTACWRAERETQDRIARGVTAVLPQLASPTGQRLVRPFVRRYGAEALFYLLTVTDHDFLKMAGFGPKLLAQLRAAVPTPVPSQPAWVVESDVGAYGAEVALT